MVSTHIYNLLGFSFCKDSNGIHSIAVIHRDDPPRCIASCLENTTANRTNLILDKVTEVIVTLEVSSPRIFCVLAEAETGNSIARLWTWKFAALLENRRRIRIFFTKTLPKGLLVLGHSIKLCC